MRTRAFAFIFTFFFAGPLFAQTTQTPPPDSGQRLHTREGFWFSAGLGYGTIGCNDCDGTRWNGFSGGLSLGTAITPRLMLGVGTTGFTADVDGVNLTAGTLDGRLRFYFTDPQKPSAASGLHLNFGLGAGHVAVDGDREWGLGLMLGLGWDIRVGRNVSITPFWNGFAMNNSNVDANVGQLGVGITIH